MGIPLLWSHIQQEGMRLPCFGSSLQSLSCQTPFIALTYFHAFFQPSDEYTHPHTTSTRATSNSNSILFHIEFPKPRSYILTDRPQMRNMQPSRPERRNVLLLCKEPRHASVTWRRELVAIKQYGNATSTSFSRTPEPYFTGLRSPAVL